MALRPLLSLPFSWIPILEILPKCASFEWQTLQKTLWYFEFEFIIFFKLYSWVFHKSFWHGFSLICSFLNILGWILGCWKWKDVKVVCQNRKLIEEKVMAASLLFPALMVVGRIWNGNGKWWLAFQPNGEHLKNSKIVLCKELWSSLATRKKRTKKAKRGIKYANSVVLSEEISTLQIRAIRSSWSKVKEAVEHNLDKKRREVRLFKVYSKPQGCHSWKQETFGKATK